jgi:hypothetical protein
MLCPLFSTSRHLLSFLPLSLQPLSYLFGLRMTCSFLFQPSSLLLFPVTPTFFLPHIPVLVSPAAIFFVLPEYLRLLTTVLFFLHPCYRLSLSPRGLPLTLPYFCQPQARGFPYVATLVIPRSCGPTRAVAPRLFWRLEWHETVFHRISEHQVSFPSCLGSRYNLFLIPASRACPLPLGSCPCWNRWGKMTVVQLSHAEVTISSYHEYRYTNSYTKTGAWLDSVFAASQAPEYYPS